MFVCFEIVSIFPWLPFLASSSSVLLWVPIMPRDTEFILPYFCIIQNSRVLGWTHFHYCGSYSNNHKCSRDNKWSRRMYTRDLFQKKSYKILLLKVNILPCSSARQVKKNNMSLHYKYTLIYPSTNYVFYYWVEKMYLEKESICIIYDFKPQNYIFILIF